MVGIIVGSDVGMFSQYQRESKDRNNRNYDKPFHVSYAIAYIETSCLPKYNVAIDIDLLNNGSVVVVDCIDHCEVILHLEVNSCLNFNIL